MMPPSGSQVGRVVWLNIWMQETGALSADGTRLAPDWKVYATPHHTGAHEIVSVHEPEAHGLSHLGSPFSDHSLTLRCLGNSRCADIQGKQVTVPESAVRWTPVPLIV